MVVLGKFSKQSRRGLLIFYAECAESVLDIPSCRHSFLTMGPPWLGLGKFFKIELLRWLENVILRFDSAISVFYKRVMLLIFYAEYIESVLDFVSYLESTMGPPWLGPEKSFKNQGSQTAGKRFLRLVLPKMLPLTKYAFFHLLHKHYVAFNSSKVTSF